jgi:hypothetical protein
VKRRLSIDELCSDLPPAFARYFRIVRGLAFDQTPNYAELRALFRELFIQSGFVYDAIYDWDVPKIEARKESRPRQAARSAPPQNRAAAPGRRSGVDKSATRVRRPLLSWDSARPSTGIKYQ